MKYALTLSIDALKEEAEAYLFYEKQSDGLGDKFLKEIEKALELVSNNPAHYTYCDATKTIRDVALQKFPFVIIFEVIEDKIIIYSIHHTKKDLK